MEAATAWLGCSTLCAAKLQEGDVIAFPNSFRQYFPHRETRVLRQTTRIKGIAGPCVLNNSAKLVPSRQCYHFKGYLSWRSFSVEFGIGYPNQLRHCKASRCQTRSRARDLKGSHLFSCLGNSHRPTPRVVASQ